ncbi:MAG: hypothetical protein ACRBFS_13145 [Aureispira sp.]
MKKTRTLLISLFLGLSTWMLSAQNKVMDFNFNMREEARQMSRATANCFVISWAQADAKVVGKSWKKYAKGLKGKLKYNRSSNEYFVDNGTIEGLENAVDVTTTIGQKDKGVEMAFWFNAGVTYIQSSATPEAFTAVEKLMRDFDTYVYAEILRNQIKAEEKALKKMEKDRRKVERAIAKDERSIKKAEKSIAKAEKDKEKAQKAIGDKEKVIAEKEQEEKEKQQMIEQMRQKVKTIR